jgi:hypothetical protein
MLESPSLEMPMDPKYQELVDAVLALPVPERAKLAQAVLESLSPDIAGVIEQEMEENMRRRIVSFHPDQ